MTDFRPELRPIIGTLAHNQQFTYSDLEEYCYWSTPRVPVSGGTIQALVKRGLIEKVGRRGPANTYFPTPAGWKWIEEALV